MSQRGQFFSPDVMIAAGVFIFALAFFWSASNSIFSQTELLDLRRNADESAHVALNSLVLSPGEPTSWVVSGFADINSFGLASSPNVIDAQKMLSIVNRLDSDLNYSSTKEKMGLGIFDFQLILLDGTGTVINSSGVDLNGGRISISPKLSLIYKRMVYYGGSEAVLEGIISLPQ